MHFLSQLVTALFAAGSGGGRSGSLVRIGSGSDRCYGRQRQRQQFAAGGTTSSTDRDGPEPTIITTCYEVCLSPGCMADGARQTLEKLQALAPPDVIVKAGTCNSICGNGPVVLEPPPGSSSSSSSQSNNKSNKNIVRHRKVSGPKLLDLLFRGSRCEIAPELVDGYGLVVEADDAYAKKEYDRCVELYERAVLVAFGPAKELQMARERAMHRLRDDADANNINNNKRAPLAGLDWLVRARRNEASARLELGDVEAAILAAQAACNLSQNTCPDSFAVLAETYRRKGDAGAELQTLQFYFGLPEPAGDEKMPFQKQNERRELGFRLAKLQREAAAASASSSME